MKPPKMIAVSQKCLRSLRGAFPIKLAYFAVIASLIGACALPRPGPTKSEVYHSSSEIGSRIFIVEVNDDVVDTLERHTFAQPAVLVPLDGFQSNDLIAPGDTVELRVFENLIDYSLLGESGARVTSVDEIQVDGDGEIYIPYVGNIMAAGKSASALRDEIELKLAAQTPNPQVHMSTVAGDGTSVSLLGSVISPGIYQLDLATNSLLTVLSEAGGVSIEPSSAKITLSRGDNHVSIWTDELYANPASDIPLQDGDVLVVQEAKRSFTALGAFNLQSLVFFEGKSLSARDAIAKVGGLDADLADAGSVFVFRSETSQRSNAILRRSDLQGQQRIIYALDLYSSDGFQVAGKFLIHDGDTLYVPEAFDVRFQKTLEGWSSMAKAVAE